MQLLAKGLPAAGALGIRYVEPSVSICHVQQLCGHRQLDQLANVEENVGFILVSYFSVSSVSWIHALHSCTTRDKGGWQSAWQEWQGREDGTALYNKSPRQGWM